MSWGITILLIFLLIFYCLVAVIMLQHLWHDVFFHAPFVPTSRGRAVELVEMADIKKGDRVYDLGCGDGRLLILAEKKGAICCGWEISWVPYCLARYKTRLLPNIKVIKKNFMSADLSQADIIFLYLLPKGSYDKLKTKLQQEMKVGTKLAVEAFGFKDWVPDEVKFFADKGPVYIYFKK